MTEKELFHDVACHAYHMELLENLNQVPLFVSSACARITGLAPEDFLGAPARFPA